ncbi:hypothetical protein NRIC_35630 [Enterococcus florum]|uniref:Uncharacterized protein n=1 Tax=Enterococcus florum TaxID=2480627 RepID=A0A4P5PJA5_9ENTE|nr:hypothetical protein [Enterococcus florum]GCF95672.1 hypothetical protein NRIC_35630 [Enterococcus florum]
MAVKKRKGKEELVYLAKWEFINALLILFLYMALTSVVQMRFGQLEAFSAGQVSFLQLLPYQLNWVSFYPVLLLCILLLIGSFYWYNLLNRLQRKRALSKKQIGRLYSMLNLGVLGLFVLYIPLFLLIRTQTSLLEYAIALFIYLFSIIEYINYFHIRLSFYTKRALGLSVTKPLNILLRQEEGSPSLLAREIAFYKRKRT